MFAHHITNNNDEEQDINTSYTDYLNHLLTYNISLLTQYSMNEYNQLYEKNKQLEKDVKYLKEDNVFLRKRKRDAERQTNFLEKKIDKMKKKPKITKTLYKIKKYKRIKNSYNDAELKRIISNIKSINDIINLEDKWKNIKHHKLSIIK